MFTRQEATPSSIYASHGALKTPEQLQRGRRGGAEGEQLFDSDYPFLSRGGVSITTLSLKPVRALSQLHCLLFGLGGLGGRLTFTQSLLTN